jgi:hypothetical protein
MPDFVAAKERRRDGVLRVAKDWEIRTSCHGREG